MYTFYKGEIETIDNIYKGEIEKIDNIWFLRQRIIILGFFRHYGKTLIVNVDVSIEAETIKLNTERSFIRDIYIEKDFKLKIDIDMMRNCKISVSNPDSPYSAFYCGFKFENSDPNSPLFKIAEVPRE